MYLKIRKWTNKLLIGMLVSIVPIVNFALLGWVIDIMRNVSQRQANPLPEWDNFGDKFVKGAILFVVSLIYSLPLLLISCPALFLPFTRGDFSREGQEALAGVIAGTGLLLVCAISVYALLLSFLMPAIFLNFARKGTFAACFEFGEIWRIMSRNLGDYIVAWLIIIVVSIGVSFVIGMVAGVLAFIPCCGWILAMDTVRSRRRLHRGSLRPSLRADRRGATRPVDRAQRLVTPAIVVSCPTPVCARKRFACQQGRLPRRRYASRGVGARTANHLTTIACPTPDVARIGRFV